MILQVLIYILYIVKSKNDFIDELGNHILNLYNKNELISNIYDIYQKNNIIDSLISSITNKIKLYHKTNYNSQLSQQSSETIDKTLVQDIIKVLTDSESESSDILDKLSDDSNFNEFDSNQYVLIKVDSEDFKTLYSLFINIINNYYQYYIDFLSSTDISLFENKSFNIINKYIIKFIIKQDKSKINDILSVIKLYFIIETYLLELFDNTSKETSLENINTFLETFKTNNNDFIVKFITSILNNKNYKKYKKFGKSI